MILIDWIFVGLFFAITLTVGIAAGRMAGRNETEFFLGGRSMPWWLLGFSMVATSYSTDTPNMVTESVRLNGIAGNWIWWGAVIGGMILVFFFSRLWRKTKLVTDLEIYALRYSGAGAGLIRGFRSLYIGIFTNVFVMATVTLAAIKIGGVMLGLSPFQCVFWALLLTASFSCIGGFRGVIYTDCILFVMAMIGAVSAAVFAVNEPEVGGLSNLLATLRAAPELESKLGITPDFVPRDQWPIVFFLPVCVLWWCGDYGSSYAVQRMLAAKSEKHAIGAVLFFNFCHYVVRPWPWIIVALASLIIFPIDSPEVQEAAKAEYRILETAKPETVSLPEGMTLEQYKRQVYAKSIGVSALSEEFQSLPQDKLGHDLAYSAMLHRLPHGWFGFVVATLIAAYVSTISTHLNWGASYLINDFYQCFLRKDASQRELVWAGRGATLLLTVLAMLMAFCMQTALNALQFFMTLGIGGGILMTMRWFWWRVNAWCELTSILASIPISLVCLTFFPTLFPDSFLADHFILRSLLSIALTNIVALTVMFLTKPTDMDQLIAFYQRVAPPGPGWEPVRRKAAELGIELPEPPANMLRYGAFAAILGIITIVSLLLGTGDLLLGVYLPGAILCAVGAVTAFLLLKLWPKISGN